MSQDSLPYSPDGAAYPPPPSNYPPPQYTVQPAPQAQLQQPPQFAPQPQQYALPPGQPQPTYYYLPPGQAPPAGGPVYYATQQAPQTVYRPYEANPQNNVVYVQGGSPQVRGSHSGLAVAAMVLFIIAFSAGIWPCHLISIAMSLHMVNVKVIPERHRPAVIAFSVLELIAWIFLPAFVWYFTCQIEYVPYYFDDRYYEDSYEVCNWIGWPALVVWYVFGLAFGIPRVVYTFMARRNFAPGCQQQQQQQQFVAVNAGVPMQTAPVQVIRV